MRDDMSKVITERERAGGGKSKGVDREYRVRDADDDFDRLDSLPRHEGMKARHRDRKSFTDVLGPLKRYLHKQAGRPWNKVMSEMVKVVPKDSVQHLHVWSHVKQFVEEEIVCVDGKLFEKRTGWRRHNQPFLVPLDHTNFSVELFVDPRTGLLRKNKWYRANRGFGGKRKDPNAGVLVKTSDPMVEIRKLKGLWFYIWLRYDSSINANVQSAKRMLNTKELRAWKLTNDPADQRAAA